MKLKVICFTSKWFVVMVGIANKHELVADTVGHAQRLAKLSRLGHSAWCHCSAGVFNLLHTWRCLYGPANTWRFARLCVINLGQFTMQRARIFSPTFARKRSPARPLHLNWLNCLKSPKTQCVNVDFDSIHFLVF